MRAADRAGAAEQTFSHPFESNSQISGFSLGDAVGLGRIGVHVLRIAPGKDAFPYHSHHTEEEFIYVLAGRGIAEVGSSEYEVGPGDFLGFPVPSVGHRMRNPFAEELVYLSGGERRESEIADFPRHGKRMVRVGLQISIHSLADETTFPGFPPLGGGR